MDEFESALEIAACSIIGLLVQKTHTTGQIIGFAEIVVAFLIAWRLFVVLDSRIVAGLISFAALAGALLVTINPAGMNFYELISGYAAGVQGLVLGAVLVRMSLFVGDWVLGAFVLLVIVRMSLFSSP